MDGGSCRVEGVGEFPSFSGFEGCGSGREFHHILGVARVDVCRVVSVIGRPRRTRRQHYPSVLSNQLFAPPSRGCCAHRPCPPVRPSLESTTQCLCPGRANSPVAHATRALLGHIVGFLIVEIVTDMVLLDIDRHEFRALPTTSVVGAEGRRDNLIDLVKDATARAWYSTRDRVSASLGD